VSVKATHGNTVEFSFQLLSNTGTFPDDVPVSLLAAVPKLLGLTGVYHNAVVTSQLVIPVMYPAQLVKSDVSVGIVGVFMKLS
jgi:hypothetical protein